jgi:hypothetical protein
LLNEFVLFTQVGLTIVVLTSQEVFLFSESLVLASETQEVDIKQRVLLGELDESRLEALLVDTTLEFAD